MTGIKEPHVGLRANNKQTALEEAACTSKPICVQPTGIRRVASQTGRTEAAAAAQEKMKESLN